MLSYLYLLWAETHTSGFLHSLGPDFWGHFLSFAPQTAGHTVGHFNPLGPSYNLSTHVSGPFGFRATKSYSAGHLLWSLSQYTGQNSIKSTKKKLFYYLY